MNNIKTKKTNIAKKIFDESNIQNLTITTPIDFISKEENEHILETLKQGLRDAKTNSKWTSFEDFEKEERANGLV